MKNQKFEKPDIIHHTEFKIKDGVIYIERRPAYCDRGAFVVKVFSNDPIKLSIDKSDMFPRYYFDWECLCKEVELWIKARRQEVEIREVKDE